MSIVTKAAYRMAIESHYPELYPTGDGGVIACDRGRDDTGVWRRFAHISPEGVKTLLLERPCTEGLPQLRTAELALSARQERAMERSFEERQARWLAAHL